MNHDSSALRITASFACFLFYLFHIILAAVTFVMMNKMYQITQVYRGTLIYFYFSGRNCAILAILDMQCAAIYRLIVKQQKIQNF